MVLKNAATFNSEELLNCIFEVLANNMKTELDKILKINIEANFCQETRSIISMSTNDQRKQLLMHLLNLKEINELTNFSEQFVNSLFLNECS